MGYKLHRAVANKIVSAIADGAFGRGQRLPTERELAQLFNVSRPTIREAMIVLECEGFIEVRHGSGIWITEPKRTQSDTPDINPFDVIEARRLFEGEAAALAAPQITADELAALERMIEAMAASPNTDAGERADSEFHVAVARATRNTAIVGAVQDLRRWHCEAPRSAGLLSWAKLGGFVQPVDDHRVILEALAKRDPQAARRAMHMHLDNVAHGFLAATETDRIERIRLEVAVKREQVRQRGALGLATRPRKRG